jgi:hypothetical protein
MTIKPEPELDDAEERISDKDTTYRLHEDLIRISKQIGILPETQS